MIAGRGSNAIGPELAALEAAIDDAAEGRGRLIVVEGVAGVGKSRFLEGAAIAATARGLRVTGSRAGSRPSANVLMPTASPLALLVDDAHRLESDELELLLQLAEGIRTRPLLLVVALDLPLPAKIEEALNLQASSGCAMRIVLRPLSPRAARQLIRAALPNASRAFCYECFTLTAGNPLLLREILRAVLAAGLPPRVGTPARVLWPLPPPAVRAFVMRQLQQLGPASATLARTIANAESELSLPRAGTLAGLESDKAALAAERLLEAGLLVPGEPLRLAIPAVQCCLRTTAPARVTGDAGPRSRRAGEPPGLVTWLARSARRAAGDPEALLAKVWRPLARGHPAEQVAADLAQVPRPDDPLGEAPDVELAERIAAGRIAMLAVLDDFSSAQEVYNSAVGNSPVADNCELELAQALSLLRQGRIGAVVAAGHSLLRRGDLPPSTSALAAILAAHARRERDELELSAALLVEAAAWAEEGTLERCFLIDAQAWLSLYRGDIPMAARLAAGACELAGEHQIENPMLVAWRPLAALCHAASGARRKAALLAEETLALAERFGTASAVGFALRVQARTGPPSGALESLERACVLLADSGTQLERAHALVDHGRALHAAGHHLHARKELRTGLDLAVQLGARRLARRARAGLLTAGGRPRRLRLSGPDSLTPAEQRVVELARRGLSNREIARELVVTRKTVEWHLSKAYSKLGITSRRDLEDLSVGLAGSGRVR